MRIYTTIRPTRDGNVIVELKDGRQVVFNDDGHGRLAADVDDEAIASYILGFPNFHTPESAAPDLEKDAVAQEADATGSQNADEPAEGEADAQVKAAEPAPKVAKKTARKTAKSNG